jgi:2,3-bisphosphoglycerate-dependent phosphoglycerate mutase
MTQQQAPQPIRVFDRAFLTDVEDATEIIMIRHGEQDIPDWNNGRVGDFDDPPLSARGRQQAKLVGERFSTETIHAVYASPLQRALDTGKEVARHHRLEPVVLDDLREVEVFRDLPKDRPAHEQLPKEVMLGVRNRMLIEKNWDVYPFSESSFEFRKRVVNVVEGIIASNPDRRVVIACHGGVINAYAAHVIGARYDMFFRPAHTSVNIFAAGDSIRAVHCLNDTHHLVTHEGRFISH